MTKFVSRIFSRSTSPTSHQIDLGVLIIAVVARFWHLNTLFHWTLDEEFWSYIPYNIATGYHFPLIGGHVSGTGLYSGPLFVWLMAPIYWLTNGQPLGIAVFVSTLGVISVILIYKLWSRLLSRQTATLTALLYAASTLTTIYDRKYWNATPISILSITTLYLTHRLVTKPTTRATLLLAFVLALAFHSHMTSGVIILFVIITCFLFRPPRRHLLILASTFALLQLPLIIFEVRHGFTNTHALLNLFFHSTHSQSANFILALKDIFYLVINSFGRLIYFPARDLSHELTLCTAYAPLRTSPPLFSQITALLIIFYAFIKLKSKNLFSVIIVANISLLFLYHLIAPADSWYPGLLSEYYLLPSYAAFLGIFSEALVSLYRRQPILTSALIIMLVVINLHTTINLKHSYNFASKLQLVSESVIKLNHQPFSLTVTGDPCQIYGYRYIFTALHAEPVVSYLDLIFLWLYDRRLPHLSPEYQLIINTDSATITLIPYAQTAPPSSHPDSQR